MSCRYCGQLLTERLIDLGCQPPSNSYLCANELYEPQVHFPLETYVCNECYLVQTRDVTHRETFFNRNYAYFSSVSQSWVKHAKYFTDSVVKRFGLSARSFVVEVASNDGYLLKNFVDARIPCLGVEPSELTAEFAKTVGVETMVEFFGLGIAKKIEHAYTKADLLICNNVYAHVPDINDFTAGLASLLKPEGIVSLEFPHLLNLIEECQFDTIYHEHYSYLSLNVVEKIFTSHGLRIFDVEKLTTHGGSLRVYGCRESANFSEAASVKTLKTEELDAGLNNLEAFRLFEPQARRIKLTFLKFLIDAKIAEKKVCAYGAAAKGNTLLNYCGITSDLIPFVCDAAPSKIGKFLPGSRIPIKDLSAILDYQPDYIVIFPWNILDEIKSLIAASYNGSYKLVVATPKLKIVE